MNSEDMPERMTDSGAGRRGALMSFAVGWTQTNWNHFVPSPVGFFGGSVENS